MTLIKGGFLVQKIHILRNNKGQSAIEFILTFAFAIGVTFLFLNQAMNATEGYLVHYVNFMASRTYLVQETGVNAEDINFSEAANQATRTLNSYPLKSFGINATFKIHSPVDVDSLFAGTTLEFDKKLSSTPFLGGGDSAHLYSESFLGKEPLRYSCYQSICNALIGSMSNCENQRDSLDIVMYDNGC